MAELWVREHVLQRLRALRGRPWEIGGWLLGYRTADPPATTITHATPPASRGTPLGVTISGDGHRPAFDALWDATRGRITYLGDWHTHPGGPVLPSGRDLAAARQVSEDADFRTPFPLVAIVGTSRAPRRSDATAISFYELDESGELRALAPRSFATLYAGVTAPEPWP